VQGKSAGREAVAFIARDKSDQWMQWYRAAISQALQINEVSHVPRGACLAVGTPVTDWRALP
jgi:hypothetical protein